ncbi:hypothetical protein [Lactococcus lactis]|uniref:hypothetical protein n=1 Tax=Lactococcus lactis TaxID=1358 RepID=UPI0028BE46D8|nr:hypothetical protein [Lactococcus lactis]WNN67448.1 hypothetical protein RIN59_06940 [Lactococcus lactis]WPK09805.1 hypothetical protein R6U80_04425 [Lactococcus lactis]
MYSDKVIVDIGGNADDRYGYSYRSKELFIKSNKKMTGMSIIPVLIISGAFPASAMNFVENHSLEISPVEWLVLTTVACLLLSFVVAIILLFLSENFFNYRNFEKLEHSKKVEKLYQMQDSKTGEIILIVFAMICGSVGITLAGLYIDSGDVGIWLIYITDLILVNLLVYIYWIYIRRARKFRTLALMELKKEQEIEK